MSDKSKDTGTGGINIDGDAYAMDVGIPDDKGGSQGSYSSGDISVDKTTKDISKPTRETFAKYLSKTTLGTAGSSPHKNVYPVGSGDSTVLKEVSLKDASGNPVPPGTQNNEAKFNDSFNIQISSNNPAGIKKGLSAGSGPDGNELLPGAVDPPAPAGDNYIKFVTTTGSDGLQYPIKEYTTDVVMPNLFDFNSGLVSIPEYENPGVPSGIRSISKTSTFAVDGGTSKSILGGNGTLSLENAAETIKDKTTGNFFPVDSPVINSVLNVVVLDSSAVLANTDNSSFFKKVGIGVSDSYVNVKVNSKGKLKTVDLPDGNELLKDATFGIPSGTDFIKFIKESNASGLHTKLKPYTTKVVELNLFDFDNKLVVLSDGTLDQLPVGIRDVKFLPATSTPETDGGTSKNILGTDNSGDYTLTAVETRTLAGIVTTKNQFPIDNPATEVKLRDVDGNPVSVTAAQNVETNSNFFIKSIELNGGDQTVQDINNKLSSYTDAFISSQNAAPPFKIKRGKTAADPVAVDGNKLLLNIAPEKNNVATLTGPAKSYSDIVVEPNLRDYSDYTLAKKTANLSGDAQAENLYDLQKTTDLATDGGTSKNILDKIKSFSFADAADVVHVITKDNFFQVDSPVINSVLNVVVLDSSANLKSTGNSKYFTSLLSLANFKIGVPDSYVNVKVNSKGKLKDGNLLDGNELLPDASTLAPPGADYIKFVTTTNNEGLQKEIKEYTTKVVNLNLFDFDDVLASLSDGTLGQLPTGIKDIKIIPFSASPKTDGGTSKNILGIDNSGDYTLTLSEAQKLAGSETTNNFFPIESLTTLVDFFDSNKNPISVTAAQEKFSNINSFTKGFSKSKPIVLINKLKTSYSNAFLDATKVDSQNQDSQFLIKRGKVSAKGETGNELLPKAAVDAQPSGHYIKFTTLNLNVSNYTFHQLKNNFHVPQNIIVENLNSPPFDGNFFGSIALYKPGQVDLGDFESSIKNKDDKKLTKHDVLQHVLNEVQGLNAVGFKVLANRFRFKPTANAAESWPPDDDKDSDWKLSEDGIPYSPSQDQGVLRPDDILRFQNDLTGISSYTAEESSLKIKRGKNSISKDLLDGNDLLKQEKGSQEQKTYIKTDAQMKDTVVNYVSEVLKKNRFSSSRHFAPAEMLDIRTMGAPQVFGTHVPTDARVVFEENAKFSRKNERVMGASTDSQNLPLTPSYGFKRLAQIGNVLSLRSTLEIQSMTNDSINPANPLTPVATQIPGLGQIGPGVPLPSEFINIESIINDLTSDPAELDSVSYNLSQRQLLRINDKFEGTINNVFEKFAGFTSLGMFAVTQALFLAVYIALQSISFIAGFNDAYQWDDGTGRQKGTAPIPYRSFVEPVIEGNRLGKWRGSVALPVGSNIIDLFLSVDSNRKALDVFGILPVSNKLPNAALLDGMLTIFNPGHAAGSMGQTVVLARTLVRGVAEISLKCKEMGEMMGTLDIFSGVETLAELLNSIRTSKVISALNIFSKIGDTSDVVQSFVGDEYGHQYLTTATKEPSWSVGRTASYLLGYSTNFTDITNKLPGAPPIRPHGGWIKTYRNPSFSRFSTKERAEIEKHFEAEYVPFYFHDLRTNEIIGFNAFLNSLSDDYTVNYDSTDAIGRVEPIKNYKSTTRKIGFSFIIAAVSQNDFNHMWERINKLITMVYPQYSEGNLYQSGMYAFEKPFSQKIIASPMIRLRIGDTIRSNYSKFNLAGVFGLTTNPKATVPISNIDAIRDENAAADRLRTAGTMRSIKESEYKHAQAQLDNFEKSLEKWKADRESLKSQVGAFNPGALHTIRKSYTELRANFEGVLKENSNWTVLAFEETNGNFKDLRTAAADVGQEDYIWYNNVPQYKGDPEFADKIPGFDRKGASSSRARSQMDLQKNLLKGGLGDNKQTNLWAMRMLDSIIWIGNSDTDYELYFELNKIIGFQNIFEDLAKADLEMDRQWSNTVRLDPAAQARYRSSLNHYEGAATVREENRRYVEQRKNRYIGTVKLYKRGTGTTLVGAVDTWRPANEAEVDSYINKKLPGVSGLSADDRPHFSPAFKKLLTGKVLVSLSRDDLDRYVGKNDTFKQKNLDKIRNSDFGDDLNVVGDASEAAVLQQRLTALEAAKPTRLDDASVLAIQTALEAARSAEKASEDAYNAEKSKSKELAFSLEQFHESNDPGSRGRFLAVSSGLVEENNNVIAKSFESVGGKGLAGFIDSINFDWLDKTVWETMPNQKAPKMCKVTVSFSPVHDISPGLSMNGRNRARSYPVL